MRKPRISAVKKSALLLGVAALLSGVAALTSTALGAQDSSGGQDGQEREPPLFDSVVYPPPPPYFLTIYHNSDGKSKLLPDEDSGYPGIARFVAALRILQKYPDSRNVITLASGSNFLASKEFNVSLQKGAPYYESIALSGLYDAMAVGTHDMDFGPETAAEFIEGFDPAVVFLSANLDVSDEPSLSALVRSGRLAKSTIFNINWELIGVIGAVTPQLPNISDPRNAVVSDVADAVNTEARLLTNQGVNKIILISHLQSVSESLELVGSLSGVDIVIAGGGGELLSNDLSTCQQGEDAYGSYPLKAQDYNGMTVPVVTVPGGYRCIGWLEADFDSDGILTHYQGRSIGVNINVTPDPVVVSEVEEPLAEALRDISSNVLATSSVALDGRKLNVRTQETNTGNLLADALFSSALIRAEADGTDTPTAAIQNGGGIRNDSVIPAGQLTEADTFDIAPYPDFVGVVEVPRETFKALLEQAVDSLPEARGQFAQIAGFRMTVDPSRPAREIDHYSSECTLIGNEGSRIREVRLSDGTYVVRNGRVVQGDPIRLATTNFLARGGDCYPLGDLEFTPLGLSYQQALAEFLTGELNGEVTARKYPEGGSGRISIVGATSTEGPPESSPIG